MENTGGKFPVWLAPEKAVLLPISEKFNEYAGKVLEILNNSDICTLIDDRSEKIGKKIRDNELKRIPYLLIIGEKEAGTGTIAVRKQGEGDKGTMKIEEFVTFVNNEIRKETEY
jgi:threonyl-tRNA synthetase